MTVGVFAFVKKNGQGVAVGEVIKDGRRKPEEKDAEDGKGKLGPQ